MGVRRIVRNLDALGVANMRTLEMKISDSGPYDQRVDPHLLTKARQSLAKAGHVQSQTISNAPWYFRSREPKERVEARLAVLTPIYRATIAHGFVARLGQTLEIAIYKALNASGLMFVGGFPDLNDHDDSTTYSKEEPPLRFSGREMPGDQRFDFLVFHPAAGPLGIEAKNVREWIYPDREEVRELLGKAVTADTVPVLIARRIHFSSRVLLETCGVMLFETFGQLYPTAEADLAAAVRAKGNIGYHDVRACNDPNALLSQFIGTTMPNQAAEYRARLDRYKDLLAGFADGTLSYAAFAGRVRRRRAGMPEEFDPSQEPDPNDWQESDADEQY